ncbi:MAG: preprotein translocase subunit SecE [bacterium]
MSIKQYISETKSEMKHVSWPTRQQTIVYTTLVIVVSLVVALYVSGLDTVLTSLIKSFVLRSF